MLGIQCFIVKIMEEIIINETSFKLVLESKYLKKKMGNPVLINRESCHANVNLKQKKRKKYQAYIFDRDILPYTVIEIVIINGIILRQINKQAY